MKQGDPSVVAMLRTTRISGDATPMAAPVPVPKVDTRWNFGSGISVRLAAREGAECCALTPKNKPDRGRETWKTQGKLSTG